MPHPGSRYRDRHCAECGAPYTPTSATQRTCSVSCAIDRKRKQGRIHNARKRSKSPIKTYTQKCPQCGDTFRYEQRGALRKFCSAYCQQAYLNAGRRCPSCLAALVPKDVEEHGLIRRTWSCPTCTPD